MASWSWRLCDYKTDTELADITSIVLSAQIASRLSRPMQVTLTMPADDPLLTTIWATDGDPYLYPATRAIKGYRNGVLVAHVLAWIPSWSGDTESAPKVQLTCFDPRVRLMYRHVYDSSGLVADGTWSNPITAAQMIKQAIDNSVTYEFAWTGAGILPIDTDTGTFSTTPNVWTIRNDGPQLISDLMSSMSDTGSADITCDPVDSSMGYTPGIMGRLNVVDVAGTDVSATVHFDYATGSKNCAAGNRILDASSLGNSLFYLMGPKISKDHWRASIKPTDTTASVVALNPQVVASAQKFGTFVEMRLYDTDEGAGSGQPLYHQLWTTETKLRLAPRELVTLTPAAEGDNFFQFQPFTDFNLGDIVTVNVENLGPSIAAQQRLYGFDVAVDDLGIEKVTQLVTSADAE